MKTKFAISKADVRIILLGYCLAAVLLFSTTKSVYGFSVGDINRIKEQSTNFQENVFLPKIGRNPAASDSFENFRSKEFQDRMYKEVKRLKKELFAGWKAFLPDSDIRKYASPDGGLGTDERIYLFISSSMPRETTRRYIADIDRLHVPAAPVGITVVMRGFIGGMTKARPTLEFIRNILLKDQNCINNGLQDSCEAYVVEVQIDPILFSRFGIEKVPALVYIRGADFSGGRPAGGEFFKVYGDASLEYLLEIVNKKTKSASIEKLLAALNSGFFMQDVKSDDR